MLDLRPLDSIVEQKSSPRDQLKIRSISKRFGLPGGSLFSIHMLQSRRAGGLEARSDNPRQAMAMGQFFLVRLYCNG